MSLSEKKYTFITQYGTIQQMTAKKFCERILEYSKSNYNWIAPISEIVRICKLPDFPEEYSLIIKIAVLNSFANIAHQANCNSTCYKSNPPLIEL